MSIEPDYYASVSDLPMRRGRFGIPRRIPWEAWANQHDRFYDGKWARRIRKESNLAGEERWIVERWMSEDGYGGWFRDYQYDPDTKKWWFDSYEEALDFVRRRSWVDA